MPIACLCNWRMLVRSTPKPCTLQARELKSVQLDAPAGAVRLVLHAPHANRYNTSAQVPDCAAPNACFNHPVHGNRPQTTSRRRSSAGLCHQSVR
jgi:hypothetical protein